MGLFSTTINRKGITNVTNVTEIDTRPIERGLNKVSDSIDSLAKAISEDKIQLPNRRYIELLNKEKLYSSIYSELRVYLSYVTICFGGVYKPNQEDTPGREVNDRVFSLVPTQENKVKGLNIYVSVNPKEETVVLYEESSGPYKMSKVSYLEESEGETVISKGRFDILVAKEKELPDYLYLCDNLEKVLFNIFKDLVQYFKNGCFIYEHRMSMNMLSAIENTRIYSQMAREKKGKSLDAYYTLPSFYFSSYITPFCIDLSVGREVAANSMYEGRGAFLDYFSLDGNKDTESNWGRDKMIEIGHRGISEYSRLTEGEVNGMKLPVMMEISIVHSKRSVFD